MNKFLLECRKVIKLKTLQNCLVIGNESCDLDSAVSAIGLAYHLTNQRPNTQDSSVDYYIPVLNVPRDKLPLKSEVVHFLRKNEIQTGNIICRDEIEPNEFNSYILVDHHVSKLDSNRIQMVFDHRPRNADVTFPLLCVVRIEEVGSCASLIADHILKESLNSTDDEKGVLKLLYGPIILDTVNFSRDADKARQLDCDIVEKMEQILEIHNPSYRKDLFDELVAARADVSELDSYQILFKDMKIIGERTVIAIPGYPIPVQDYIRMQGAEENVLRFAAELNCDVVVLMGMKITGDGQVRRSLAIVNIKNPKLFADCKNQLEACSEFQFNEVDIFMGGPVYEQSNVKLSRKQVLPILNKLIN